ncbi:MAG: tRNA (adenosine(37)-N6)-threonylcarbamoyltransferase complex dimerization subunit type 1 TsaB [Acidobacteria bacterium]|nr:tRNA (adenosine(37)-N6)-threonylcarbamoyltransferase complex dimerization subunit type 1 TsaB [Acidobacteriota bacterium]
MSNSTTFKDSAKPTMTERAGGEERSLRARAGTLMLCLDTATEMRSVAVVRGSTPLSLCAGSLHESGASSILSDLDEALRAAGTGLREIELLGVCTGPGSFTGLRAGLATVKALAASLRKPVVGVPTLHAIAYHARPAARLVAMLPAGRGEVFAQLLRVGEQGDVEELGAAVHLSPAKLLESALSLGGGLKWAGGGAAKYLEQIGEAARAAGRALSQISAERREPAEGEWLFEQTPEVLAHGVAALALSSWQAGSATSAEHLRAIYVRPSDAELNERCHEPG